MTTEIDEKLYLYEHLSKMQGKREVCYNPLNRPVEELPVIMCFNNGGSPKMLKAIAMAEDGHVLGQHCCSDEAYMRHDLGVLEGCRLDRHTKSYGAHYPEGYRMEFVPSTEVKTHEKLTEAYRLNQLLKKEEEGS